MTHVTPQCRKQDDNADDTRTEDVCDMSVLADEDSRFLLYHNVQLHYKISTPSSADAASSSSSSSSYPALFESPNAPAELMPAVLLDSPTQRSSQSRERQPHSEGPSVAQAAEASVGSSGESSNGANVKHGNGSHWHVPSPSGSVPGSEAGSEPRYMRGATPALLLHGFGASLFSWHALLQPLAALLAAPALAFDRPAFGITLRPLPSATLSGLLDPQANPYSVPFSASVALALASWLNASVGAKAVAERSGGAINKREVKTVMVA